VFADLKSREKAVAILGQNKIRYRTGKTLVPFRLSGNVKWGIPVPEIEGVSGLTFWCWPESLWAPVSFCKTVLGDGSDGKEWEKWWKSDDAKVYQFVGEDNIYFYVIAGMALFMALDEGYKMPIVIPNRHILYGKTKSSSSSDVKPPTAAALLEHYTPEQLRLHFMNASLSERSVGFEPKAILGKKEGEFDTVLYEGNLVTNILNRLVRSCFYTVQKFNDGILPELEVSKDVKEKSDETVLEYERLMSEIALDKVFELLNLYLRDANKNWATQSKSEDVDVIKQLLTDSFHIIRTAAALFDPITPVGCEMIREYLNVDERIRDWEFIFEPLCFFVKPGHKFKFLEPRIDFFEKHPSQLGNNNS
jgi:methionyl-tRNA synthetase